MRVLVTGGAGYIGSHTAKRLKAAGHEPIVLDSLLYGHTWAVQWGPFEKGDLADVAFLRSVFDRHAIDAVIHFAANAYVGESMTDPSKYFRNNTFNTLNLLDTMVARGVKRMVFSSTCATYGDPQRIPIDESHPQAPVNPYGESKLFVERILYWYGKAYELRSVALRYFNASGADPDGAVGEDHDPETHLIPLVLDAAIGRKPEVRILGTDYPTPDGTCVRDFIHVSDLASAHVAGLQALLSGKIASQAINLGTGSGYSVREVVETARRITKSEFLVTEAERREGDPPVLVAAVDRAKSKLGWKAVASDLEQIISSAWNWHRRRFASR